jgi:hypothetical protein
MMDIETDFAYSSGGATFIVISNHLYVSVDI